MPHFNAFAEGRWSPANIRMNFTSPETRGIVLPDAKTPLSYLHSSRHNTGMWQNMTEGQTDGILWQVQRSALRFASNADAL